MPVFKRTPKSKEVHKQARRVIDRGVIKPGTAISVNAVKVEGVWYDIDMVFIYPQDSLDFEI